MIIRGLEIDIKKIVIQIRNRNLGSGSRQTDLLKGKIGHNGVDVVGQGLIHLHKYVLSRGHGTLDEM